MSLLLTKVYGFIDWFVKGGAFVGPVVSVIPAVASPHQLSSGGSPVFYWGGGGRSCSRSSWEFHFFCSLVVSPFLWVFPFLYEVF